MAAEETDSGKATKKSGAGIIIVVVVTVLAVLAVAGGAYYYLTIPEEDPLKGIENTSGEMTGPGVIYSLEPFFVNLAPPDNEHIIKLTIKLEVTENLAKNEEGGHGGGGGEAKLAEEPQIRDKIITILSSKKQDDLFTAEGKTLLRKEIQESIKGILHDKQIQGVYFQDFVIQ